MKFALRVVVKYDTVTDERRRWNSLPVGFAFLMEL